MRPGPVRQAAPPARFQPVAPAAPARSLVALTSGVLTAPCTCAGVGEGLESLLVRLGPALHLAGRASAADGRRPSVGGPSVGGRTSAGRTSAGRASAGAVDAGLLGAGTSVSGRMPWAFIRGRAPALRSWSAGRIGVSSGCLAFWRHRMQDARFPGASRGEPRSSPARAFTRRSSTAAYPRRRETISLTAAGSGTSANASLSHLLANSSAPDDGLVPVTLFSLQLQHLDQARDRIIHDRQVPSPASFIHHHTQRLSDMWPAREGG